MAQRCISPREYVPGWKYDNRGPVVFPSSQDYAIVGAVLASRFGTLLLRYITQGNDFNSYHIDSIPLWSAISTMPVEALIRYLVTSTRLQATQNPLDRLFSGAIDPKRLEQLSAINLTAESVVELAVLKSYNVSSHSRKLVFDETGIPAGIHPLVIDYDVLPELTADLDLPSLPHRSH